MKNKQINTFKLREKIFQKGSRTYFYASKFFPPVMRQEVSILYAFVRSADDFVDKIPADRNSFIAFKNDFNASWHGQESNNWIISDFVKLAKTKDFPKDWIDSFLEAMEADLNSIPCQTLKDTEKYIYGSAEVVGLMMAKIMKLPVQSYPGAKLLGKAMQYINFIRDLQEDELLGRQYLPQEELQAFGLNDLKEDTVKIQAEKFNAFMQAQIVRYLGWQKEAEKYYHYIPLRFLIPIKTAAQMYLYTAQKIKDKPEVVWERKVKPEAKYIILSGFKIAFITLWNKYFPPTKRK